MTALVETGMVMDMTMFSQPMCSLEHRCATAERYYYTCVKHFSPSTQQNPQG